jgi:integration host factor subunit alpha
MFAAGARVEMTKADLARAIYERHGGLTMQEARRLVDTIFDVVRDKLISGQSVRIVGFGTLEVIERKPRRGRNPTTGEEIRLESHRALVFRPSRVRRAKREPGVAEPSDHVR